MVRVSGRQSWGSVVDTWRGQFFPREELRLCLCLGTGSQALRLLLALPQMGTPTLGGSLPFTVPPVLLPGIECKAQVPSGFVLWVV